MKLKLMIKKKRKIFAYIGQIDHDELSPPGRC